MEPDDYTGILVCLLPETCQIRQAALKEDSSSFDVSFAAHVAQRCLQEELDSKGIPPASFQAFMVIACRLSTEDQSYISSEIHDKVCGCHKRVQWSNKNERELFTLENIDRYALPTEDNPWTNGVITAWASEAGSRKRPITDVRFYKNDQYVGSVTIGKDRVGWKLYCLKDRKPYYPKGEYKSFTEARDALVEEVS